MGRVRGTANAKIGQQSARFNLEAGGERWLIGPAENLEIDACHCEKMSEPSSMN
jgi:hypothetical protein